MVIKAGGKTLEQEGTQHTRGSGGGFILDGN